MSFSRNVCRLFTNLSFNTKSVCNVNRIPQRICPLRQLSTTKPLKDLMEFFDDKNNWGENEVKTGRSWTKDELRIKSNEDLHKLWYVLLKERNMLLTMEEECKSQTRLFPSPERIDKVEESMENLENVVRERNRAYYELETGETGERGGEVKENIFGLRYFHKPTEHLIPKFLNVKWRKKYILRCSAREKEEFLLMYREKLYLEKKRKKTRDFNHVIGLMNRFPNLDMEAVKIQYPDVDIEKAKASRRYKPRYIPKE